MEENNLIHIDMDAFFASVEEKYAPELKNIPIAICGSISERGVVSTANYNARKFGVHSAMPVVKAKQLCPDIKFIEGNFELYKQESLKFEKICSRFTPDYEKASIDEIYLDVSKSHLLYGSTEEIARKIKKLIKEELNLSCSVGISFNKIFAKIASDLQKPNGFTVISRDNFKDILFPLPIEKIPGIGKKSKETLNTHKIFTIKDLFFTDKRILSNLLGVYGERLFYIIRGVSATSITPQAKYKEKSISNEITLNKDTTDYNILKKILISLVEKVSERLRKKDLKGKTIKIKIKYFDFNTVTKQLTLNHSTNKTDILLKNGITLLEPLIIKPVRLIGFGVNNFSAKDDDNQLNLFTKEKDKNKDNTIDTIREKFGSDIIKKAALL